VLDELGAYHCVHPGAAHLRHQQEFFNHPREPIKLKEFNRLQVASPDFGGAYDCSGNSSGLKPVTIN